MHTFASIIDDLGGCPSFGEAIGVPDSHARAMKARGSIPARYWHLVIADAARKAKPHITFDLLARLAEERANAPRETPSLVPEQIPDAKRVE